MSRPPRFPEHEPPETVEEPSVECDTEPETEEEWMNDA